MKRTLPGPLVRAMTALLCMVRSLCSYLEKKKNPKKTCKREASLLRAKPDNAWANTAESPLKAGGARGSPRQKHTNNHLEKEIYLHRACWISFIFCD